MTKKIPERVFKKIASMIPISCVDAVVKTKEGVLLIKRKYEPAKGEWWIPGGVIQKGETIDKTIARKVKEETGLRVKKEKELGVYTLFFQKGYLRNRNSHMISHAFLMKKTGGSLKLDNNHSEYKFINKIPKGLHWYIRDLLIKVFRKR